MADKSNVYIGRSNNWQSIFESGLFKNLPAIHCRGLIGARLSRLRFLSSLDHRGATNHNRDVMPDEKDVYSAEEE
jgi:hypothetical protein